MRAPSTNAQLRASVARIAALTLTLTLSSALAGCEAFEQPADHEPGRPPAPSPDPRSAPEAVARPAPAELPAPSPGTGPGRGPAPVAPVAPVASAPPPSVAALGPGAAIEDERNTISVFEAMAPATVFVTQTQLVRNRYTMRVDQIPAGTGTGFIWDEAGHVVTNFHVVAGGDSFSVTLYDGATIEARLVGGDPKRDIAVLALDRAALQGHALASVRLPEPDAALVVGQKALAIGNPFGLDHTLTTGVISALDREVVGFGGVTIRDMIQTDASINPGNSGGPLLDSAGQLIGMNTMIFSKSGSSAGIGFAVPVATIRRLVPQIIQYGKPRRAGLGVEFVNDTIARRVGVRGVIIERVEPGGPAAAAGLRGLTRIPGGRRGRHSRGDQIGLGDVIVGINDDVVTNFDDLFNALERHKPGDTVKVKVLRGGEVFALDTTLALLDG